MNIYYDFHIHSCLSPCGDDDNTPNNIVNMALIKGLNAIALSDHNTGKNCPATIAAGKKNGLVVLPAMELTTSEDIHVLCLFEKYEQLAALEEYIVQLVMATRRPEAYDEKFSRWVAFGASPRGTIALDRCARARTWLSGRDYVLPEDIHAVVHDVLRHRIILTFEAEAEGVTPDSFIDLLLSRVPLP